MYPINQDNKLFYNGRPKLEPMSTQRMAQRNFEENLPISINTNLSCQTIKLPKVVLPQVNPVISPEDRPSRNNDIEIIDLCSSEGED